MGHRFPRSLFAAGLALFLTAAVAHSVADISIPADAHKAKNPLPKTDATLLAGAAVYRAQCAGCHGPEGTPTRNFPRLKVQPATLSSPHVQHLSEGDIFYIVTHGEPGGMPAFDDLSENDRWQAVSFVKHINKAGKLNAQLPPEKQ